MNSAVLTRPVSLESSPSATPAVTGKLSPAEMRVAQLVADGLTNRQIGERLFISHRTVDTHVSHLFSKLNVNSRVRLALAMAA
jgi:DNA-binding NarL/FixJ family response regulator